MAGDYVPHAEAELIGWAERFVAYLESHEGETRITAEEVAKVRSEFDQFAAAHSAHRTAHDAARAARKVKDAARKPLVHSLRCLSRRIHADPVMSGEVKGGAEAIIGTSPRQPKLGMSDDRPHAIIDVGHRLRHVIRVMNENSLGVHKARPSDVYGCQLWRQIGDETDQWEHVTLVRGKPLVVEYPLEAAGRRVRYRLRWMTRGGRTSAWSGTYTATVAA